MPIDRVYNFENPGDMLSLRSRSVSNAYSSLHTPNEVPPSKARNSSGHFCFRRTRKRTRTRKVSVSQYPWSRVVYAPFCL